MPGKKFIQVSFLFCKLIERRFLGLLLWFDGLCCEHTVLKKNLKNCRKTKFVARRWNRKGWDFYSCVFRYKHHVLNLIIRMLYTFARTDFWTKIGDLRISFSCLNFCRAGTVLYIASTVDNGCLQPLFLVSFIQTKVLLGWFRCSQWTYCCFEIVGLAPQHLHIKSFYSLETWNSFFVGLEQKGRFRKSYI